MHIETGHYRFASSSELASPEYFDESKLSSTDTLSEPSSFKGLPGIGLVGFGSIIIPPSVEPPSLSQDSGRAFRSGRSQISPRRYSGTNSRVHPVPRTVLGSTPFD